MDGTVSSTVTKCKRDTLSGVHGWKIEGIADLLKTYKEMDQPSHHSCPFHLLGCQWKALFWPYGTAKKEFEDTASFQLVLISSPRGAPQTAKITVEVSHRPETRQQSKLITFEPLLDAAAPITGKPCTFKNFLPHKEFPSLSSEDCLKLEIVIEVVNSRFERQEQTIHATAAEQLAELQKILQSDLLKDIHLTASDTKLVPCNSLLLCQASPVVAAACKYAASTPVLDFKQYGSDAVQAMVHFVSAAKVPPPAATYLPQLYELAHEKMICKLVTVARTLLLRTLSTENVYPLYQLATHFNDLTFIRHIEDFGRANIPQLLKKRPYE